MCRVYRLCIGYPKKYSLGYTPYIIIHAYRPIQAVPDLYLSKPASALGPPDSGPSKEQKNEIEQVASNNGINSEIKMQQKDPRSRE